MPYIPEEINGHTSEMLPKGDVIEGSVIPQDFQAPAGMDDMPGNAPEQINLDGLTRFLASVADLAELKAEFDTIKADSRYQHSDKKGIKAIFDARIAELQQ